MKKTLNSNVLFIVRRRRFSSILITWLWLPSNFKYLILNANVLMRGEYNKAGTNHVEFCRWELAHTHTNRHLCHGWHRENEVEKKLSMQYIPAHGLWYRVNVHLHNDLINRWMCRHTCTRWCNMRVCAMRMGNIGWLKPCSAFCVLDLIESLS